MSLADVLKAEAYQLGRRAANYCQPASLNPYPAGTEEHAQWAEGHRTATNDAWAYASVRIERDRLLPYPTRDSVAERRAEEMLLGRAS